MYIRPDRTYSNFTVQALNIEGYKHGDKAKKRSQWWRGNHRERQDESSAEKYGYKQVNDLKSEGQGELRALKCDTVKIHFYEVYIT